jgi:hypothetical protein
MNKFLVLVLALLLTATVAFRIRQGASTMVGDTTTGADTFSNYTMDGNTTTGADTFSNYTMDGNTTTGEDTSFNSTLDALLDACYDDKYPTEEETDGTLNYGPYDDCVDELYPKENDGELQCYEEWYPSDTGSSTADYEKYDECVAELDGATA